jgi:Flp pilus assembly pilin Flp
MLSFVAGGSSPRATGHGGLFLRLVFVKERNRPDDHQGVTAMEYALMLAMIAMVIIVAVQAVGDALFKNLIDVWQMLPK